MSVHPKIIATGIVCAAVLASFTVYAERTTLFGGAPVNNATSGTASTNVVSNIIASNPTATSGTTSDWQKRLAQNIAHSTSSVQILTTGTAADTSTDDNTLTAQLSKQFFSLYLADQKNGVAINDTEAQNIAAQALANVSLTSTAKQYEVGDLKISQDLSLIAIHAYANNLKLAATSNFPKNSQSPVDILNTAITSDSEADAAKLDPVIKSYQGLIRDTLKISVPVKVVGYHVIYLDTLSALLTDVQEMRQVISDPLTGYIGFTNYQKDTVVLQKTLQSIDVAFSQ